MRSFTRQVSLAFLIFATLPISVYAYIDYRQVSRQWREAVRIQAKELTEFIALGAEDDMRFGRYFELWARLKTLRNRHSEAREGMLYRVREIAVLDAAGNVFSHTDPLGHPLGRPYDRPLPEPRSFSGPPQGNYPVTLTASGGDGQGFVAYAPIVFGGERIGSVVVGFDTLPLAEFLGRLMGTYLFYLTLSLVGGLLLALAFGRWVTRPLHQAVEALPAMGGGTVALPALVARQDEYANLGRAIESADRRIHQDQEKLLHHRDELEQMVARRTAALTASNKELEAFSYSVSHDMRAPLRSIDGFSQALLEDYGPDLDPVAQDYLRRIRGGAQTMGQLIDEMLQLSRVTRRELKYERIDLSALAAGVISRLRQAEPLRRVEVQMQPDLWVAGDAGLLLILLENLLGNAWKYTGKAEQARIELGCRREGAEEVFFVKDNGAGFDMRYAGKLFTPFQRLHHRDDFPGTGVGLATVQRVINRHGGRIWAEAEVGWGAVFHFVLPGQAAASEADQVSPLPGV